MLETFQRCFEGALAVARDSHKSQRSPLKPRGAFVDSVLPSPSRSLVSLERQSSPGMRMMLPRDPCVCTVRGEKRDTALKRKQVWHELSRDFPGQAEPAAFQSKVKTQENSVSAEKRSGGQMVGHVTGRPIFKGFKCFQATKKRNPVSFWGSKQNISGIPRANTVGFGFNCMENLKKNPNLFNPSQSFPSFFGLAEELKQPLFTPVRSGRSTLKARWLPIANRLE